MLRSSVPRGGGIALHHHAEAQLIYAASGTMQVYTEAGRWLVPPHLAVWVPAGVPHGVTVLSPTDNWMIYWSPESIRAWAPRTTLDRAFALRVSPRLRELIFAPFERQSTPAKTELVVRLILHELTETLDAPTFLPLPTGIVARRVAELALADPQALLGIHDIASRAATSMRTISRLFPAETGLTFKAWRQRARIVLAIDRLAAGVTVSRAAVETGFSSTAAFCFAFRQVTAMSPGAFLRGPEPLPSPSRRCGPSGS